MNPSKPISQINLALWIDLVDRFAAMATIWDREDRELVDARCGLPPEERDPTQEFRENERLDRARAQRARSMVLEALERERQREASWAGHGSADCGPENDF